MPDAIDELLNNADVRYALKQAWLDSSPGESRGHETGGFIVRDANGVSGIVRWLEGTQKEISVSAHTGCKIDGNIIVSSFHTHPNSGASYFQEPSGRDIDEVRFDPDLVSANLCWRICDCNGVDLFYPAAWRRGGIRKHIADFGGLTMTATMMPDVLQDRVVASLANALAAANRKAEESGVVLAQNVVTISQMVIDQIPVWRTSYHPPIDFTRRGGGLLIEVSAEDATIRRVLNEQ